MSTDRQTLDAGRELDALVAEQVMRWRRAGTWMAAYPRYFSIPAMPDHHQACPLFSTDIAAAWLIVPRMREIAPPGRQTLRLVAYPYSRTYATFDVRADEDDWSEANGEHATPLAICLAALAATPSLETPRHD